MPAVFYADWKSISPSPWVLQGRADAIKSHTLQLRQREAEEMLGFKEKSCILFPLEGVGGDQ